jgi:hypothetical protein
MSARTVAEDPPTGAPAAPAGAGPVAEDWTVDELMITRLAACFVDGDQACNGMASFIPVSAFMLARLTHAPDLVWLASAVGLEPRPERVPASTLEAPLWRDSVMYMEQFGDFWHYALNGRWLRKFCVGAAQLDRFGNANNSVIGSDRQAALLLEPEPQPAVVGRESRRRVLRRLSRRWERAGRPGADRGTAAGGHEPVRAGLRTRHQAYATAVCAPRGGRRRCARGHRVRAAAPRWRGAGHPCTDSRTGPLDP